MNSHPESKKTSTFAFLSATLRRRTGQFALVTTCAVLLGAAYPTQTQASTLLGDGSAIPAGDWRMLADLTQPSAFSLNFVERGTSQFAANTKDGLSWSPNATNLYTIIYASKGRPAPVADHGISVEFQLPSDNSSLGLHVHAAAEASASHLVLVNRSTADRGLLRAYRTPLWPSATIDPDGLLSSVARITHFPAETWYRLTVTTRVDEMTGHALIAARLTDLDGLPIASIDAIDTGPALPASGLFGLRFFAPGGSEILVRRVMGQPKP